MVLSSSQWFAATGEAAGWVPKGAIWLDGTADYLTRTNSGSATSDKTFTVSYWFKNANPDFSSGENYYHWGGTSGGSTLSGEYLSGGIGAGADAGIPEAIITYNGGTKYSDPKYRDPTAWQHFVFIIDSANAFSANRNLVYHNGTLISWESGTDLTLNTQFKYMQDTEKQFWGVWGYFNETETYTPGYFSECALVDGLALGPESFGTEDSNGCWIPKDLTGLTWGNYGFWLDFADSTDTTTIGYDVSGNTNHFTTSSFASGTSNWTYDRPADDSGTATGNLCTWNSVVTGTDGSTSWNVNPILSEGNTKYTGAGTEKQQYVIGTIAVETGKYAWRVKYVTGVANGYPAIGLAAINYPIGYDQGLFGADAYAWAMFTNDGGGESGKVNHNGSLGSSLFTLSEGDYVDIALDLDNNKLWFGQNGTWSGDPAAGTGEAFNSGLTGIGPIAPVVSGGSYSTTSVVELDITGVTLPTGFKYLNTANLPAPTITNPSLNFLPVLYEGNGAGQRVGNFIPFEDAYTVNYSARFDRGGSDYLSTTLGTGGDTKTWTLSLWIKRGMLSGGSIYCTIMAAGSDSSGGTTGYTMFRFNNDDTLELDSYASSARLFRRNTNRKFTHTDNWVNIIIAFDSTETSAGDRIKIYVNGVQETSFAASVDPALNEAGGNFGANEPQGIGTFLTPSATDFFDGYMSEIVFVDGTALAPSSFGETDTSTNRWIPKDVSGLTFGDEGFYLEFGTGNDLGDDTSGNTNDFTETNMDTTNGSNQMYDTPTRNFATIAATPYEFNAPSSLTVGNLDMASSVSTNVQATQTWASASNFYFEIQWTRGDTVRVAIFPADDMGNSNGLYLTWNSAGTYVYSNNVELAATLFTASAGEVIGVHVNGDTVQFYQDGTSRGTAYPINPGPGNTAQQYTVVIGATGGADAIKCNFGQWRYWDGTALSLDSDAGGYFRYTVPTDAKAITQDNRDENTAGITGFAWLKDREATESHMLLDRVRGIYEYITSDGNYAQATSVGSVQRFLQQGVQIGNEAVINADGNSNVLWQWVANGTGTLNEEGSIDSTVSANTDAGFSIATFEGTGANATVGHGLSAAPEFVMIKNTATTNNWAAGHTGLTSWSYYLVLDQNAAQADTPTIFDGGNYAGGPTAAIVYLGSSAQSNGSTNTMIMYSWVGVEGYSKFGSYPGNDDDDGPFVYLGFKPAWLMIKRRGSTGNWTIRDDKRNPYNPVNLELYANGTDADYTEDPSLDFTSNGFKLRDTAGALNADDTYIYCAFAENPFGGSGVGQARAR